MIRAVQLRQARRCEAVPVCVANVRVAALVERLGFVLEAWQVEGLGTANGFHCRLPSGLEAYAEELAHAVEHLGAKGPTFYVPTASLLTCGLPGTMDALLLGLGLARAEIAWVQSEAALRALRADLPRPAAD